MTERLIVGVDVSKFTLDSVVMPLGAHLLTENITGGFKKWYKWVKQCAKHNEVLVVMEHTGHYSHQFELFLQRQRTGYVKLPAVQIKQSMGVVRGKTDKVDAFRIAQYGWLRRETLNAEQYGAAELVQLKDLLSLRDYWVRLRSSQKARLKEMHGTGRLKKTDWMYKKQQQVINDFDQKVKAVEKQMVQLIKSQPLWWKNYQLLQSIKGIGKITAAYVIALTDNFTRFTDARKFNCYAGLAPFDHQSGTSIRTKSRVSHLANKTMKCLLRLNAFVAVRYNHDLKNYYQTRVSEGKSKMSVLNIIGAKLVKIMFAVVKRQTPYIEHLKAA